jgi:hypothetical protein
MGLWVSVALFLGLERNKTLHAQMKSITRSLVTKLIEIDDLEKTTRSSAGWFVKAIDADHRPKSSPMIGGEREKSVPCR